MYSIPFYQTQYLGGFWHHYSELNRSVTVRSVYARLAETGRFDALRCDWQEGQPNRPHIFWDSDVAKWLEAVAYLLETGPEPDLEAIVDASVEQIAKNQLPNGYFNSYYIRIEPENIFTVRDNHELYCAGHLIEAAVAYDHATGKHLFLQCMMKYADYIDQRFRVEQSAGFYTPGHEEIELALLKMASYTGIEKYQALAAYFLKERSRHEEASWIHDGFPPYNQSDVSLWQAEEAKGHCVRACYLYTAMADYARKTSDSVLQSACDRLFRDICDRKLSITGGIGACVGTEGFALPYDLPNTNNYNETCAAIALSMFAAELQQTKANSEYADVVERVWYNGMLSGISLSGDAFFYENALEIDLKQYDYSPLGIPEDTETHTIHMRGLLCRRRLQRAKVFNCFCCPPNIARMLASAARNMYSVDGSTIYCHQFAKARTEFTLNGQPAVLEQDTDYPVSGKIAFTYHGAPARLAVRIPGWCVEYVGKTENGYAFFDLTDGGSVSLELPMNIHFVQADPRVREDAGRYAVTRGPIVYCLESVDNGENLWNIELLENGRTDVELTDFCPAPVLTMDAERRLPQESLYSLKNENREKFRAKLIPYFAYANRGLSNMQVWTMVK